MAPPRVAGERSRSPRAAAVYLAVLAALSVGGCAAASPAAPPTRPTASGTIVQGTAASCAGVTPSQRFAAAKVVFDGNMLSERRCRAPMGSSPPLHGFG
jgi:hypothetical protein